MPRVFDNGFTRRFPGGRRTALALTTATLAAAPAGAAAAATPEIFFHRTRANGDTDVWRAAQDGSGAKRLTRFRGSGGSGSGAVSVASRANAIAYVRAVGGDSALQVFVARRDGSKARQVTRSPYPKIVFPFVAISPRGDRIAYITGGSRVTLWLLRLKGSRRVAVARAGSGRYDNFTDVRFSPDGRRLTYVRNRITRGSGAEDHRLVTNSISGGDERTVLAGTTEITGPRLSPDGTRIAFGCRARGSEVPDLCIISADGTAMSVLIGGVGTREGGGIFDRHGATAAWSPDGQRLIFDCGKNLRRLCLARADGSDRREIGVGARPDWG